MTLEARHAILDALLTVLDADHAEAVLDHRKSKKSPLTAFAAKLLAKQFALCPDPNAAAEEMILRGWQGFKAEWLVARSQQQTGKRNYGDLARDRINGNGSESIFGTHSHDEQFPASQPRPKPDDGNLRIGFAGHLAPSRH